MEKEKRLIDADALRKSFEKWYSDFYRRAETFSEAVLMKDVLQELASHPAVDAVEVVRCKDCKHCCLDLSGRDAHLCMRKEIGFIVRRKQDDFCSYGERRIDNG